MNLRLSHSLTIPQLLSGQAEIWTQLQGTQNPMCFPVKQRCPVCHLGRPRVSESKRRLYFPIICNQSCSAFLSSVISKIMDLLAQEIFFENHCITLCYLPKSDNEEQWAKMALIMWAILTSKFDTMKNMSMLRVMKFTLIVVKYRWKKSVSHSCPAQKKKNLIFLLLLSLIFVWTDCFQTKFPLYFLRGRKALLCHHPS